MVAGASCRLLSLLGTPSRISGCRFYNYTPFGRSARQTLSGGVVGKENEPTLDLRHVKVGQQIIIPYDVTVGSATQWQSTFYQHDRLYTSKQFARRLNLRDRVLPFAQILCHAISMSHIDHAREILDLGLDNAQYVRPAFAGDTFHKTFTVKSLRPTKDGKDTVAIFLCELFNQQDHLIFRVDKAMMFRGLTPLCNQAKPPDPDSPSGAAMAAQELDPHQTLLTQSHLYSHLLFTAAELPQSSSLACLEPGDLILHNLCRPVGQTASRSLATSFRLTHPLLLNSLRYSEDELVVSGGLTLAAAMAASSKCLYEVLTEALVSCSFLNRLHPSDLVAAMTYIKEIRPVAGEGGLEEISVRTIGVKNCDITRELRDVPLPMELFQGKIRREIYEDLVRDACPQLSNKMVVAADRILVRQSPYGQMGSMPLL